MSESNFFLRYGAIALLAGLSACASAPAADKAGSRTAPYQEVYDPFEPMNRKIFAFNMGFDKVILRPAAVAYRAVLPMGVREANTNFLDNLESPVIFLNDLLQLKPARAGNTLARFGINTFVGFLGFFDPAEAMGIEYHDEDFAQTLGHYGVSSGPYLMLPFLGPLPPRDTAGFVVDIFTDPMTYILWERRTLAIALFATDTVDVRHQFLDQTDELERSSVDYYAAIRSLYMQRMDALIHDGKVDHTQLPDFDDME